MKLLDRMLDAGHFTVGAGPVGRTGGQGARRTSQTRKKVPWDRNTTSRLNLER